MIDSAAIAKAREALPLVETYLPYGRHSVKMLSDFINEVDAAMKAEPAGYTDPLYLRVLQLGNRFGCVYEADAIFTQPLYATPLAQQRPLSLDAINEWTARRIRAAGGIEGVTNIPSIMEEAVRFAEAAHNIKEKP